MKKLEKWVNVRFTKEEHEAIKYLASVYDCRISDIVRRALDEFILMEDIKNE